MSKWLFLAALMLAAGCSNKTETGYEPHKLSDSEAVRRAYYAPKFSPEAREAEADRGGMDTDHRPVGVH